MAELAPGATILTPDGRAHTVDDALAAAFGADDRLAPDGCGGLLHIPAAELAGARAAVDDAVRAFGAMQDVSEHGIARFYGHTAAALGDDDVWRPIEDVNAADVEDARRRGRSTTRLAVSDAMREKMIDGLNAWAAAPSQRGAVLQTVRRDGFRVELVGAALGVVAFVFEGRPNVLADACGVLRGGNTVVFRIGRDALATARAIMRLAIAPALARAGLPPGAVRLIDSPAHAAGWALFLDSRLALAVARGSGPAVETLGALARGAGTPVSLHGTGGAWIVASETAAGPALRAAVTRSLDRKVCNTLNTCCLVGEAHIAQRAGVVLDALAEAGAAHGGTFKLHVARGSEHLAPAAFFDTDVEVARAGGTVREKQAQVLAVDDLGVEWEWEETPEISLVAVPTLDAAVALFNRRSPRLVATLVSNDAAEHERFFATIDAPFVGDDHSRWVDGQFALGKPELGLSNWQHGRLLARGGVLTGDGVYTVRMRYRSE